MATDASSVVTTGAPPSTVVAGKVNLMSIQVPDSGALSTTCSPTTSSRAPVAWFVAERLSSCTSQSAGSAMRCTGLVAVRPAHSTSGASSTIASGPRTSVRPWRREFTFTGVAPEAST